MMENKTFSFLDHPLENIGCVENALQNIDCNQIFVQLISDDSFLFLCEDLGAEERNHRF